MDYKQSKMEHVEDHNMHKGATEISTAYNHANMGKPFTGSHTNATADAPKYKIFGEHEIGEHYGRSGSPSGKKFRQ